MKTEITNLGLELNTLDTGLSLGNPSCCIELVYNPCRHLVLVYQDFNLMTIVLEILLFAWNFFKKFNRHWIFKLIFSGNGNCHIHYSLIDSNFTSDLVHEENSSSTYT